MIAPNPDAAAEVLIDTDTISLYMRHHPQVRANVIAYLGTHDELTFSELTRYEITRGLRHRDSHRRLAMFERVFAENKLLAFDGACAERAADVWVDLARRGEPIGEVDVLIAGTALAHRLAVVSRNVEHFRRVTGLTVIDWTQ